MIELCFANAARSASSIASIWLEICFASASLLACSPRSEPARFGLGGIEPVEGVEVFRSRLKKFRVNIGRTKGKPNLSECQATTCHFTMGSKPASRPCLRLLRLLVVFLSLACLQDPTHNAHQGQPSKRALFDHCVAFHAFSRPTPFAPFPPSSVRVYSFL
jgi:hypothetical protein